MMDGPLRGHLGIKSGPFAPTDAKLTSQYMVLDHMNAHYRKLSKAKSAVDCSAPKAWAVSQKVRDQARRVAVKKDMKRQKDWLNRDHTQSYACSEADRDEMYAMLRSYQNLPEAGPDELDGRHPHSNTTMEAHASSSSAYKPDARDLQLIGQMVDDPHTSPSKYHSAMHIRSNIPADGGVRRINSHPHHHHHRPQQQQQQHNGHRAAASPRYYQQEDGEYAYLPTSARGIQKPMTPRSGDLLEQHDHKFTEPEKPFQPRTLKTNTAQSRLSSSKCYNPPKKASFKPDDVDGQHQQQEKHGGQNASLSKAARARTCAVPPKPAPRGDTRRGSMEGTLGGTRGSGMSRQSRPETPYSEVDWMNETLMSRDGTQAATPAGVPALNISLDADHVKWIKEQTHKAHVRSRSETGDDLGSTWGSHRGTQGGRTLHLGSSSFTAGAGMETMNGTHHQHTMNGTYEKPLQHGGMMSMSGTLEGTGGRPQYTLSGSIKSTTGHYNLSAKSARIDKEEEELKYLAFIQDVTNDVLDRNIFTNRVLKNVFESHVEKRKNDLRISKMREMLDDLRMDLGIPDSEDDDGMGLKSTLDFSVDPSAATHNASSSSSSAVEHQQSQYARRKPRPGKHYSAPVATAGAGGAASNKMPNLRYGGGGVPKRCTSPDAKPPLPRPSSRGSQRRPDSAGSSLRGSGDFGARGSMEEPNSTVGGDGAGGALVSEDLSTTGMGSSTFGMVTALQTTEQNADILTIQHEEAAQEGEAEHDGSDKGVDETDKVVDEPETDKGMDETDQAAATEDTDLTAAAAAVAVDPKEATDDEEEMPAKFKMVNDMTLSYQYALEDTLDTDGGGVSDSADEDDSRLEALPSMQTLAPIIEVDTPKEKSPRPPRPTPKRRSSLTPRTDSLKDTTPRSQAGHTTSESIDISDLEEDDEEDDF